MNRPFQVLLATAVVLCGCTGNQVPLEEYPQFSFEKASPLLVVGYIRAGDYLPQFEACSEPNTICMDPPPFWFEVKVIESIYGDVPVGELVAATTSHYGLGDIEWLEGEPLLIYLVSDGHDFIMPRYSMKVLDSDAEGAYHVIVSRDPAIHWLPCEVANIFGEIEPQAFPKGLEISLDRADQYLGENAHLFRVTDSGLTPRYSIRISDLHEYLKEFELTTHQMKCDG